MGGDFVLGPEGRKGVRTDFLCCKGLPPNRQCKQSDFRRATQEQAEEIKARELARNESQLICRPCCRSLGELISLARAAGAALGGAARAALQGAVISGDGGRRPDSVTYKALFEFYKQQHASALRAAARSARDKYAPEMLPVPAFSCCLPLLVFLPFFGALPHRLR